MKSHQREHEDNSLRSVMAALFNVAGDLMRKYPMIVVIFFGLLFLGIYSISASETPTKLVVSILIGIFSIGIYLKSWNFSETILTLFLGLLTVFSIEWTRTNTIVFTGVLFTFAIIFFLINSVRLHSEVETILTQAASFISVSLSSFYYKQLYEIASAQTEYKQLGVVDRAKSVRYLVFMSVPIEQLSFAISIIEMIKVVYQVTVEASMKYYFSFYQILSKKEEVVTYNDFEQFHERVNKLQITPDEFLVLFDSTKYSLINGKLTINEYFDALSNALNNGSSREMIIDSFKNL